MFPTRINLPSKSAWPNPENATLQAIKSAGQAEEAAKVSIERAKQAAGASQSLQQLLVEIDRIMQLAAEASRSAIETVAGVQDDVKDAQDAAERAEKGALVYADVQLALVRVATSLVQLQAIVADVQGRFVSVLPVESGGTGVTYSTGSGGLVLSDQPTLLEPVLQQPQLQNTQTFGLANQHISGYQLLFSYNATLSANRTLSLNLNNQNRTLALNGDLNVTGAATLSGDNTGDQDLSGLQPLLQSGVNIKTLNSSSLLGAGDVGVLTELVFPFAVSDETTAVTAGSNKIAFHWMHQNIRITEIVAGLTEAQTSGARFTIDVRRNGTSVFSTLLSFDNNEDLTTLSSVAAVLSSGGFNPNKGDRFTVDVPQIGDATAKGLKLYFIGSRIATVPPAPPAPAPIQP